MFNKHFLETGVYSMPPFLKSSNYGTLGPRLPFCSNENEDPENEDRRPKTPYENEDPLRKRARPKMYT